MAQRDKLTPLQRRFVELFLSNGRHQSDAYRDSGYSVAGWTPPQIANQALKLLQHPLIAAAVAEADAIANAGTKEVMERYAITQERILSEYAKIAFSNMMDYMVMLPDGSWMPDLRKIDRDSASAISAVKITGYERIKVGKRFIHMPKLEFKLADKKAALDSLARTQQMFRDIVQTEGTIEGKVTLVISQDDADL